MATPSQEIASLFGGVSRATIYRALNPDDIRRAKNENAARRKEE